jgi:hypothetical protein
MGTGRKTIEFFRGGPKLSTITQGHTVTTHRKISQHVFWALGSILYLSDASSHCLKFPNTVVFPKKSGVQVYTFSVTSTLYWQRGSDTP